MIAAALHMPRNEINWVWMGKGSYSGLHVDFLYQKASSFLGDNNIPAFESILALIIYGMVLFPQHDKLVSEAAIQIFLSRNLVPTLLSDALYYIHTKAQKRRGCIFGSAPLLFKWFILHLPKSLVKNANGHSWAKSITHLTYDQVVWYPEHFGRSQLFDRCGDFPNIPLLGMVGGTSYNPVLAQHQLGFALKEAPRSLYLSPIFFQYKSRNAAQHKLCALAWNEIKWTSKSKLGEFNLAPIDPYFKWIYDRVMKIGLSYPSETPVILRVALVPPPITYVPFVLAPGEDLFESATKLKKERDDFERLYHAAKAERSRLESEHQEDRRVIAYLSSGRNAHPPDQNSRWEQEIADLQHSYTQLGKKYA